MTNGMWQAQYEAQVSEALCIDDPNGIPVGVHWPPNRHFSCNPDAVYRALGANRKRVWCFAYGASE